MARLLSLENFKLLTNGNIVIIPNPSMEVFYPLRRGRIDGVWIELLEVKPSQDGTLKSISFKAKPVKVKQPKPVKKVKPKGKQR
jgi:hypothetical protein